MTIQHSRPPKRDLGKSAASIEAKSLTGRWENEGDAGECHEGRACLCSCRLECRLVKEETRTEVSKVSPTEVSKVSPSDSREEAHPEHEQKVGQDASKERRLHEAELI